MKFDPKRLVDLCFLLRNGFEHFGFPENGGPCVNPDSVLEAGLREDFKELYKACLTPPSDAELESARQNHKAAVEIGKRAFRSYSDAAIKMADGVLRSCLRTQAPWQAIRTDGLRHFDPDAFVDAYLAGNVKLQELWLPDFNDAEWMKINLEKERCVQPKLKPGEMPPKFRIKVYADTFVVEIDGTPYPLKGRDETKIKLVSLIQALIDASGAPVSATDLGIRTRDVENQCDEIKSLIGDDTKPGSGYRIPLEKLLA